jgi:hypothetical protein
MNYLTGHLSQLLVRKVCVSSREINYLVAEALDSAAGTDAAVIDERTPGFIVFFEGEVVEWLREGGPGSRKGNLLLFAGR